MLNKKKLNGGKRNLLNWLAAWGRRTSLRWSVESRRVRSARSPSNKVLPRTLLTLDLLTNSCLHSQGPYLGGSLSEIWGYSTTRGRWTVWCSSWQPSSTELFTVTSLPIECSNQGNPFFEPSAWRQQWLYSHWRQLILWVVTCLLLWWSVLCVYFQFYWKLKHVFKI